MVGWGFEETTGLCNSGPEHRGESLRKRQDRDLRIEVTFDASKTEAVSLGLVVVWKIFVGLFGPGMGNLGRLERTFGKSS